MFTAKPLCEPYKEILDRAFRKKNALLEYNPGKCIFTPSLKNIAPDILNCEVREDDVWFISYPRTGKALFFFVNTLQYWYIVTLTTNLISAEFG